MTKPNHRKSQKIRLGIETAILDLFLRGVKVSHPKNPQNGIKPKSKKKPRTPPQGFQGFGKG
jgi:hypothetical protein